MVLEYKFSMKLTKGFTLIELIVMSGVVVIVITVAIDLFVSIVRYQRKVLAEQEISSQMSYIIEYMARAIRMAKKDSSGACLGATDTNYVLTLTHGDIGIKFINHSDNDVCQEFFRDLIDQKLKESKNNSEPISLISDNLQVNYFKIKLSGESSSDSFQPRVTISMEIQARGAGDQPKKQIQTTISQRNIDSQ